MGDVQEHEAKREWLNAREVAALFYELMRPHAEEYNRIANLQLKESQKATNALFILTGDGVYKGQLPQILENEETLKSGQQKIIRRVRRLEKQREIDHAQNQLNHTKTKTDQDKKLLALRREMRAIRRNQLWVIRKFRGVYDWCTTKDESGRYSRGKLSAFALFVVGVEEFARHWMPIAWHKIVVIAQAVRM